MTNSDLTAVLAAVARINIALDGETASVKASALSIRLGFLIGVQAGSMPEVDAMMDEQRLAMRRSAMDALLHQMQPEVRIPS